MAIRNWGFGVDALDTYGEIGTVQWAQMASYLGAQYSVLPVGAPNALEGLGGYLPNSGERRIDIRTGAAVAYGVYTVSDTVVPIEIPGVTSGSRWYVVGFRRDWTKKAPTPPTTLGVLGQGATIAAALNTLTHNPGVLDDQPLWAVQATAGNGGVTGLVDLRVWGSGSQLIAHSTEVLNYLSRRGTEIRIGNLSYTRTVDQNYNEFWSDSRGGGIINSYPGTFLTLPPSGALGSGVQVWGNARQVVGYIDVADPGVPWRFAMHAQGFMGAETPGTSWRFTFEVDDVEISAHVGEVDLYSSRKSFMCLPTNQIFTGAKRIHLIASRRAGTGYGAIIPNDRGLRAVIYGAAL